MDLYDHDDNRQLRELEQRITERINLLDRHLSQKLERIMAAQDDVNAAGEAILGLLNDMQADITTIGTGITAIQAALAALPAEVDTTQLNADVAQIAQAQANLDAAASSVANVVPPAQP